MNNIGRFLTKALKQDCVYWSPKALDGYGNMTYNTPIAVKCRWEDKQQLMADNKSGQNLLSRAIVFLPIDVHYDGLLWLGALTDLTDDQQLYPRDLENICIVKRFEKTSALASNSVFVQKAFLTPWLT